MQMNCALSKTSNWEKSLVENIRSSGLGWKYKDGLENSIEHRPTPLQSGIFVTFKYLQYEDKGREREDARKIS